MNLNITEFKAPNKVLLYGAGENAKLWVTSYKDANMNIVGFIDKQKTGFFETLKEKYPIYSIQEAINKYGSDTKIINCIRDKKYFSAVMDELIENGFKKKNITNWCDINYITVPSENYYCQRLFNEIQLFYDGFNKCCFTGQQRALCVEPINSDMNIDETVESFIEKIKIYKENSKKGEIPIGCVNCSCLTPPPRRYLRTGSKFNWLQCSFIL